MQRDPLMEKLGWVFTSSSWTISYPSSLVYPLARPISDHVPCVVTIEKKILRLKCSDLRFFGCITLSSKILCKLLGRFQLSILILQKEYAKLKNVRRGLKLWAKNLPCLKKIIA
jgi:hypothetical protein